MNRFFLLVVLALLHVVPAASLPPIEDRPFWQEYHEAYPLATPAENDVRAVAVEENGRVWAATAAGVRFLENGRWHTPPGGDIGPAFVVGIAPFNGVWIGAWNGVYRFESDGVKTSGLHGYPITALSGPGPRMFAGGPDGIWRHVESTEDWLSIAHGWVSIRGRWNGAIRGLASGGSGLLWIATASGLYHLDTHDGHSRLYHTPDTLLSSNLYTVRRNRSNTELWIGSTGGLDCYEGKRRTLSITGGPGAMPNRHARALAWDTDGRLWVATKLGVARFDGKRWALRHSRRWLLSDDTRDVAIGPDGTAWVATAEGVSAIRRKRMTLAQKADYFLKLFRKYNVRPPGLVGPANLEKAGDLSRFTIGDTDNDGSLTAYACVFESYRYVVTKAPDAKANATEAFGALEFLQTVTSTDHFFARTAVPIDVQPLNDLNHVHTPHEIAELHKDDPRYKPVDVRWRKSKDGEWLWKGDTSSDEVDGHLYAFGIYHDLAAGPSEKARVARLVDKIVGGIVDAGYELRDIDGTHTRWGIWSPEKLNGDENWHEERGVNSAEMISFLNAASHVTGNPRYAEAKRALIEKHGYARNTLRVEVRTPSEYTYIDNSLMPMVYPNLIGYETDPALRAIFQASLIGWHRPVERDGRGHYDFLYNRYSGRQMSLEAAVQELRDWPLDGIDWTVDTSQREDVQFDRTPGLDEVLLTRKLPADERGLTESDGNPRAAVRGNPGKRLHVLFLWLLDYWQARYFGQITQEKPGANRNVGQ